MGPCRSPDGTYNADSEGRFQPENRRRDSQEIDLSGFPREFNVVKFDIRDLESRLKKTCIMASVRCHLPLNMS